MPGLIHNLAIAFLRKFPLPDPIGMGLKDNSVIRQAPSEKQIRKGEIVISDFNGSAIYQFGQPVNGEPVLYFCHGGGFVTGMFKQYYDAMMRLRKEIGTPIICPDYPMPPETDARGVVDFTLAHFRSFRKQYPDSPIIISGDSAGGHLTLTLTQALSPEERKAVSAIFPLFPVTDMRRSPLDIEFCKEEVLLYQDVMEGVGHRFVGEFDKADPIVSPICGELSGLPPVHLYSADKDPLYLDSKDLEAAMKISGQDHTHHVFEGFGHDFILFFPTPDGVKGLRRVARHMKASFVTA